MKLIKLIDYTRMWKGKDGKERPSVGFFLEVEYMGEIKRIAITNKYKDGYSKLEAYATVRTLGRD